jgi:two-component system, NtrC family, response regulator
MEFAGAAPLQAGTLAEPVSSSMKPSLLLVDDDDDIRSQMKWALGQEYDVMLAEDGSAAIQAFRQSRPLVTLLDLGLPPRPQGPDEGLATLASLLAINRHAKIIIVTGQGEKKNALQAIGQGAYDFLCKPVEMEEIKVILRRACHVAQLEREYSQLRLRLGTDAFEGMLGMSPQMQEVFAAIRKVASTGAPVLILGESGTGKEMVAQAIHRRSARKDGPFVAINCAAIPESLLESELFGHEKGAFTGAHVQRKGRIESAADGTLFLDEVGELPLQLQVKLLRFLQEHTIERVGGRAQIPVDARIVAATNTDLKSAMLGGRFREDLYYRLAVVVLKLSPLRERPSDILLLAKACLRRFSAESGKELGEFSPLTVAAMEHYSWPGNVRELENRVKRAVIMADGRQVTPADLELDEPAQSAGPRGLKEAREELERMMVVQALQRRNGKITSAAADLGISRPTLYELMEKLGVQKPEKDKD